ncbi:MAG TPA: glycosyltransferase family 4 protein [Mycobacteriales bacterium]|nr:glycosyltransferase family 4 protein [Mycobacteriales bacterium]
MRVLVVAAEHPLPADNGLRLHLDHLLRALRERHDVSLVSLTRPGDDLAVAALAGRFVAVPGPWGRAARLRQEMFSLPSRRPVLVEQVRSSGLAAALRREAAAFRPDVVHLEPGWAAGLAAAARPAPVVLATLDAWHLNWAAEAAVAASAKRRVLMRREAARMRRFEATAYADADAVVVVSERDADVLRALDPRIAPEVVTNGVDTAFWAPDGRPRDARVVLFTGAMGYAPNVDAAVFAATEVLPLVRRTLPDVRLVLAGRDPAPAVLALASDAVEVTGTLRDLRPLLWSAGAYLCPMRSGTGVKNKLLEALAAGAPCVATPLATGGLGLTPGTHALVTESADDLAAAVVRTLSDRDLGHHLSTAGRAKAAELSWYRAVAEYERIYRTVQRHSR